MTTVLESVEKASDHQLEQHSEEKQAAQAEITRLSKELKVTPVLLLRCICFHVCISVLHIIGYTINRWKLIENTTKQFLFKR